MFAANAAGAHSEQEDVDAHVRRESAEVCQHRAGAGQQGQVQTHQLSATQPGAPGVHSAGLRQELDQRPGGASARTVQTADA